MTTRPAHAKKSRGRPPKTPGEPKRSSFNTRIRSKLKSQLEHAAVKAGRSMSEEIEYRLEQSFVQETAARDAIGPSHVYPLMKMLGSTVTLIEEGTGKKWRDDRFTHVLVMKTIDRILDALGPQHSHAPGYEELLEKAEAVGEALTAAVLGPNAKCSPMAALALLELAGELTLGVRSKEALLDAYERLIRQGRLSDTVTQAVGKETH